MAKKDSLKDTITNTLIDELAKDGYEAIKLAYQTKDYTDRTYNLHDSYGSAVYNNGKLIKRTISYVGQEKYTRGRYTGWIWNKSRSAPNFRGDRFHPGDEVEMTGREEVMDFFSQYTPPGRGLQLVIIAAMWYGTILEKGGGNLKKKYRVISGAKTIMDAFAKKYHGSVTQIETGRVLSQQHTFKGSSWK